LINVAVTVLAAYPLAVQDHFPGKNVFKWALIFSMLFSGGLIPWFIAMRSLGLLNSLWGLILYPTVSAYNIIIAVNFFRRLPQELADAAAIDGASHWGILFYVFIPLSLPMLATVTLFTAVMHWNSWFDGLVLMTSVHNYPLQTFLQTQLALGSANANEALSAQLSKDPYLLKWVSERSVRAAEIILTVIPIVLLYPFLQRYFIHGLTLGSVKE
jgi:ABC-type glycerol-3-phosphate transport system permease component